MIQVVSAFIIRKKRVCMTQRREGKQCAFLWETPGGKKNGKESDADALCRELDEEVGIFCVQIPERPLASIEFPDGEVFHNLPPFAMRTYLITDFEGTPTAREGQGIGWFTARDLLNLDLCPANSADRAKLIDALERS